MKTNIDDATLQAAFDEACVEAFQTHENLVGGDLIIDPGLKYHFQNEAPARLALARAFLDHLPEPTPPVVDGKTPGEVNREARFPVTTGRIAWRDLRNEEQAEWEAAASAVLAAFGNKQASLDAAIARMEAVPWKELEKAWDKGTNGDDTDGSIKTVEACFEDVRSRLIDAARGPINLEVAVGATPGSFAKVCDDPKAGELPMSEIQWTEWHGGECPLDDNKVEEWEIKFRVGGKTSPSNKPSGWRWGHYNGGMTDIIAYRVLKWREGYGPAVDWKAKYEEAKKVGAIHKAEFEYFLKKTHWVQDEHIGTVGMHRIDCINAYVAELRAKVEKAEAELARVRHIYDSRIIEESEQPQLPRLRPIAEAGPVPEGAVRVYFYEDDKGWFGDCRRGEGDTHCADILRPKAIQPLPIATLVQDQVEATPAMQAAADAVLREEMEASQPAEEADPYAELKAAHAAGKVIQVLVGTDWLDMPKSSPPSWCDPIHEYRIKPEPSTFEAHGKTWTRHTPGDPMPCGANEAVHVLLKSEKMRLFDDETQLGDAWDWSDDHTDSVIIGWRYADEPTPEPLDTKLWTPAVGAVVRLKSGGPKMTVMDTEENGEFWCQWFNESGGFSGQGFPAATLQPA